MKILYHHRTMARGAEGHHIRSIAEALQSQGHEVVIVGPPGVHSWVNGNEWPVDKTNSRETGARALWKMVSRRCPQWIFEVLELGYNLWAVPKLIAATKKETGLLYERYAFYLWAGAFVSWLRGMPHFLEVNEVAGLKRARGQFFKRLIAGIERKVFRRATGIFVVSSSLKGRVEALGVAENKIFVVPNAVDPERFVSDHQAVLQIRSKYGFENCLVLGFVGWFDDWDNLETLLSEINELRKERSDIRLMLVGAGKTTDILIQLIERMGLQGTVVLTGPVERKEVPNYIGAMNICLLPDSNMFGSPIVLFEYMYMGKPVLARNLPPIRDVIIHNINGLLFSHLKDESFRKLLLLFIRDEDLRERVGNAARNDVFKNHTWVGNSQRILEVYRSLRRE
jgi:glycosyltransferase involved in cell wall biosynthesis